MATTAVEPAPLTLRRLPRVRAASAVATLAARRAALTARNPRQIAVPPPHADPVRHRHRARATDRARRPALEPRLHRVPIAALPAALTDIAKALPLTHVMALMRYGLIDRSGAGLHDIWGGGMSTATDAWLSLAVVLAFAAVLAAVAVRSFTRAAVR
jgi:hypothetical protein